MNMKRLESRLEALAESNTDLEERVKKLEAILGTQLESRIHAEDTNIRLKDSVQKLEAINMQNQNLETKVEKVSKIDEKGVNLQEYPTKQVAEMIEKQETPIFEKMILPSECEDFALFDGKFVKFKKNTNLKSSSNDFLSDSPSTKSIIQDNLTEKQGIIKESKGREFSSLIVTGFDFGGSTIDGGFNFGATGGFNFGFESSSSKQNPLVDLTKWIKRLISNDSSRKSLNISSIPSPFTF